MSEQLTEGERTVLEELLNLNQRVPTSDLASHLNQGEERVISILNSLASRELVEIHTKERVTYLLTDEGADYVDSGLPEVRLFTGVKELGGKATFDDAVAKAGLDPKAKGIAMNWFISIRGASPGFMTGNPLYFSDLTPIFFLRAWKVLTTGARILSGGGISPGCQAFR